MDKLDDIKNKQYEMTKFDIKSSSNLEKIFRNRRKYSMI